MVPTPGLDDIPDDIRAILTDVLLAWGRTAVRVTPLAGGDSGSREPDRGERDRRELDRWEVDAVDQRLLLRSYEPARSSAMIAFQHDLLAYLAQRSWPVSVPLATRSGATVLEAHGARWVLSPLLSGAPAPDESIFLQRRGALLALVHADLAACDRAAWDRAAGRDAVRRVDDFDGAVQAHGLASFEALLARVHAVDARRANALAVLRARVEEQLAAYGYARLPTLPLWGGCTAEHVLFDGDDVTGLTAFDEARSDARVVDIAESVLADTRSVGWRIIRWVAGYSAHAVPPLSAQEADLLPVIMAALTLRRAVRALAAAHAAARIDERALAAVDAALTVEAHEADLRQVIRTAARLAPVSGA